MNQTTLLFCRAIVCLTSDFTTFCSRFFQTGNKQQAAAAANIPQQRQQGAYLYNPTNLALFPSLLL